MRCNCSYKKIKSVCSFVGDGDWIESKDQSESGIRLIQTGNIGNGVFKDKEDKAKFISSDTFSELGCTEIFEGDCLISRLPDPIGRCCILPKLEERTITAVDCTILRFNEEIIPQYFVYYSQSRPYSIRIQSKTTGSTRKRISRKNLENIDIPIPSLEEQERIVSELNKINELIRLKKEQLVDYDKLAQSLFYDIFGDPVNNEKGWNVKKLGDVCEVSSFKRVLVEDVLEKGPVPFIRGTELSAICKENKREYKMYITMEHYERVKNISGVPNVGDLLIPSINAEGLVWVVDTPEPMYYKDGRVLWVHVDQNSISPIALQRILNNLIKDNYSKITNGAVFAELNLSILRSFPVILPPLSIQNAFAKKITLIEKQKAEIQSTIADLETLLASRMQYWFD